MKPRVMFVLQNAWRRGARPGDRDWNDRVWRWALWQSRTGRRLKLMIPAGVEFEVMNASPYVATHPSVRFEPDLDHVREELARWRPDVVVLLGAMSGKLAADLASPALAIVTGPHPAHRLLSNTRIAMMRAEIARAALRSGSPQARIGTPAGVR